MTESLYTIADFPKAPKGHFWRFKQGSMGLYTLELRKQMWGPFSYVSEERHFVNPERVVDAAGWILDLTGAHKRQYEENHKFDKYLGDTK